jgi:hypothetical protein
VFSDKNNNIYYQPTFQAVQKREIKLPSGNIPAFACGPLTKERYINPKIEQELIDFKIEIRDKFTASKVN